MLLVLVAAFVLLLTIRIAYEYLIRDRNLPPGPPRLPLIGNLHQAPKPNQLPWHVYADWARQYGPIFSVQFGGSTLIMLAEESVARELLEKRGSKYSDRPRLVMANELVERGMQIMFMDMNDKFRLHQRMEAPVLTPRASVLYEPLQDLEGKNLLKDLLHGDDFKRYFERYAFSLMSTMAYGERVASTTDQEISELRQIMDNIVDSGTVGKWIVDTIPVLNYLPTPLAPWKRVAERFYQIESSFYIRHLKIGLENASWTWAKEFAQSKEAMRMNSLELAYDVGILVGAGVDTTAGVLQVFVLAAASYPDAFQDARAELDAVVGRDRLPMLDDKARLPMVTACMKEVFRWRSILPCTFPHQVKFEDEYMGYRIPANSTIIPLQWCMNLDDKKFANPYQFKPHRWLEPGAEERRYHAFGYGRRICPGRHIAENSVFLAIARMLWAYDIKPSDQWKAEDVVWDTGFFTQPMNLRAEFTVRSPAHRATVEREWQQADLDVGRVMERVRGQLKQV